MFTQQTRRLNNRSSPPSHPATSPRHSGLEAHAGTVACTQQSHRGLPGSHGRTDSKLPGALPFSYKGDLRFTTWGRRGLRAAFRDHFPWEEECRVSSDKASILPINLFISLNLLCVYVRVCVCHMC